ncbi:transcriptional regulator [Actibacterium mucosum KCTC 23349]|uniref:Transcriptional regulator n=1 Tax=Actibacterium mucosum KCTC 23349 TaxID=1454373 RepID=A0A037ZEX6_9RHOB|nr:WYL domain-containing protein [Actibacterium mucosum]KAJ55020.1 transcriptional regulator [Actibacterium mucosum KCTC 23349]
MTGSTTTDRLHRLDRLEALLKQDMHRTVQDMAQDLGVSTRTVSRDLELLRERGLPIDADRGRGGGVRLDRNWGVGRLNLAYADAIDLLISIEVAEQMGSALFLANLASVRRQLVASFSPERRRQIDRLKSRIIVGITASTYVQAGVTAPPKRVVQALHQAFLDQEVLAVTYQREDGAHSKRHIEPHYLLLKYPVWYVIAHDRLRNAPRTFRCDRIVTANRTGDRFDLCNKTAFESSLRDNDLLV